MFASAGIILAGGQSRRMGKDKALLPVPGSEPPCSFLAHLATTLLGLCSEVVLVVRDTAQAQAYSQYDLPADVRVITDDEPGGGPLVGLASGLQAIQATHALAVAVDMPFVQPSLITWLLSQPQHDELLVPVVQSIPQVLLAVYPRSILPTIKARLQSGRRDPRSLLSVALVRYIEEAQLRDVDPQLRSFVNVNTPDEYAEVQDVVDDENLPPKGKRSQGF